MSLQAAQDAVTQGTTLVFRVTQEVGELRRSSRYIVRHDRASGEIIVSDLTSRRFLHAPVSADSLATGLTLWGEHFLWDAGEGGACLHQAKAKEARCSVLIIGPLVPDALSVQGDLVDIAADRLIAQLKLHLSNPQGVIDRGRSCPRNPALNQTHVADRFLADALYFNGQALPYITNVAQRTSAETLVDAAINRLITTVRPSARTTYTECYGGLDLITPLQVARALDAMNRLRPDPRIRDYLRRMWQTVLQEGAIETYGARNAMTRTKFANAFAAYLHIAAIMESIGVHALQPFTRHGLDLLLAEQTQRPKQPCLDATGSYALAFGGWPHSDSECSQNVGYHDFIVGGLIAAHEYYTRTGACQRTVADLCHGIEHSLDNALDWINSLKQGPGKAELVDRAPGSSNVQSKPGSGNVVASATGFRIMAYRRTMSPDVRATLLLALQEAIRSRPNHLPIAAYLRSVAFAPARIH
ncbi:hypothetical protein [Bradyrhizobium sp. CCBAU 45394]|uniref:hypothetical protein n=1 Tax=Bradyrhizobium sp. CCBAU 45394 TaxID=1325087 RepID=UPI002302E585|nr:hypothetical protein [Bradyrhizobium sp. CCBAU 45394]